MKRVRSLSDFIAVPAAEKNNRRVVAQHVYGSEVSSHNVRLSRPQGTPPSFPLTAEQSAARRLEGRMNHQLILVRCVFWETCLLCRLCRRQRHPFRLSADASALLTSIFVVEPDIFQVNDELPMCSRRISPRRWDASCC